MSMNEGLGRINDSWMQSETSRLSERGRAMLRVIEYFAKSLKITQGHSKW